MKLRRRFGGCLASASDELNHLRYFLVTTQEVFGEFSYAGDLLSETFPKEWLSEYESENGVLTKRMRTGKFERAEVIESFLTQYQTLLEILTWAIRQIRFELGVSERPPSRQYSGYNPRQEPYMG